jgi:tetratricopeptide (TPR) repeat protein
VAKGSQPPPVPSSQPLPEGQRLESWKEIAAYLKRDLRTVQRWERRESLPIHRHVHDKRSSVYVYTSELDAWRNNGRPHLEPEEPAHSEPVRTRLPRERWVAVLVATTAVATIGLYLSLGRRAAKAEFHQRDWVLIANFQNRTGEPLLDGVLELAMERDLSDSDFLNIVPRERIGDNLQLMKKAPDTPIDPAVGREVCLRDGGIRGLLTGYIDKAGTGYVLRADLTEPMSGFLFARASERAADQNSVLDAALRLSSELRKQIREPLTSPQPGQNLEQATTSSLRALQLYSQGMAMVNQYSWESAAALLEQAVSIDPQFASAHIYLAWCYSNLGENARAAPHFQQAFALADTTTDRERYFILGSYYQGYSKERDKAIEAYKALVSLYPDDYWGNSNLAWLLESAGEDEDGVPYAQPYILRRAELRPTRIADNFLAAMAVANNGTDLYQADQFVSRLQGLLSSPEVVTSNPQAAVWAALFSARKAWARGDPGPLFEETDRLRRTIDLQTGPAHEHFQSGIAAAYMLLGRFKSAWELQNSYNDPADRYLALAFNSYARDDQFELKRQLTNATPFDASDRPEFAIPLLARVGAISEARRLLSSLEEPSNTYFNTYFLEPRRSAILRSLEGELSLARGDSAKGIRLLQESLSPREGGWTFLLGSEALARAWELKGNLSQAIRVLEHVSTNRTRIAMGHEAFIWVHLEGHLAQLYRKAGRDEDADRTEAELRRLLTYADPDNPLLVRLKQSATLASAQRH